jgi:hypothetical protein
MKGWLSRRGWQIPSRTDRTAPAGRVGAQTAEIAKELFAAAGAVGADVDRGVGSRPNPAPSRVVRRDPAAAFAYGLLTGQVKP